METIFKNNDQEVDFDEVANIIKDITNYRFDNKRYLIEAFMGASYLNENKIYEGIYHDYQDLECLGDKCVDNILTIYFFNLERNMDSVKRDHIKGKYGSMEGFLTGIRECFADGKTENIIIENYNLKRFFLRGNKSNTSENISGQLFESIIGAIAVDSAFDDDIVRDAVLTLYKMDECCKYCYDIDLDKEHQKTTIQEWYRR